MPEQCYIDVYKAMGGWQSRMVCWYPEDEMWDIQQTGMGPYKTKKQAEQDAEYWAKCEKIEYRKG